MTSSFVILAAGGANAELIKLLIVAVIMVIGGIMKLANAHREQQEKAKSAKPRVAPPQSKQDPKFRNEIEVFLEEVGRRRPPADQTRRPSAGPPPIAPPPKVRPVAQAEKPRPQAPPGVRPKESMNRPGAQAAKAAASAPSPPVRPGAEMAARKAPVSNDLGTQVRDHLSQYLDPNRLSKQVQSDLGNSIEKTLYSHMGQSVTSGTADKKPAPTVAAADQTSIPTLLRNRNGLRNAILLNEILQRPKSLRDRT